MKQITVKELKELIFVRACLQVMKAVDMPLVEHDTCQAALQGTRIGPGFVLHDSFLCAGGEKEGQDACTGDGGSPLVCPLRGDPSRYVQVRRNPQHITLRWWIYKVFFLWKYAR